MKNYILFYLIYWGIFIPFIFYKTGLFKRLVMVIKTILGLRKFYIVKLRAFREQGENYVFTSFDNFSARQYDYALNHCETFDLIVEDFSKEKQLNDNFYPTYIFMPVTAQGKWREAFCNNLELPKKFKVAKENIISMQPTKIKIF